MVGIIDYAELSGRDAVDRVGGMDDVGPLPHRFQRGAMELRRMADLKRNLLLGQVPVDAVEMMNGEILLIGRCRIVAM